MIPGTDDICNNHDNYGTDIYGNDIYGNDIYDIDHYDNY